MHLTTLTSLLLFALEAQASFQLVRDDKWYGTGCSLQINACGCNKKVNINHVYKCHQLPDVLTRGGVCGGRWTLFTGAKGKGNIVFSKGKCIARCNMGGELGDGSSCE